MRHWKSLRSWYIKGTDESTLVVDLSTHLTDYDQSDLRSLILIQITSKECTLNGTVYFQCRLQCSTMLDIHITHSVIYTMHVSSFGTCLGLMPLKINTTTFSTLGRLLFKWYFSIIIHPSSFLPMLSYPVVRKRSANIHTVHVHNIGNHCQKQKVQAFMSTSSPSCRAVMLGKPVWKPYFCPSTNCLFNSLSFSDVRWEIITLIRFSTSITWIKHWD